MRRTAVMSEPALRDLLGRVMETTRVMAPVKRGKVSFDFQWVNDPAAVVTEYVRTVLPPKSALLPPRELLLKFDMGDQAISPVLDGEASVLFGVHPCDLKAIGLLDWSMGQRHGVTDPNYAARREAVTIVGMECRPDEYCFCTSVGSCDTRQGADLFLTPVEGGFFVEVLTEKGEALLKGTSDLREGSAGDAAAAKAYAEDKKGRTTCAINAEISGLPDALDACYDSDVFEATALRCYSCGTCTSVCPTCFCFDVDDKLDLLLATGERSRSYDSCQYQDFALVAGGHNFRGERADRVRHRWFRKFVHLLREHGEPFCVGCGRCSSACTAGISLVDVLNTVAAQATEKVAK